MTITRLWYYTELPCGSNRFSERKVTVSASGKVCFKGCFIRSRNGVCDVIFGCVIFGDVLFVLHGEEGRRLSFVRLKRKGLCEIRVPCMMGRERKQRSLKRRSWFSPAPVLEISVPLEWLPDAWPLPFFRFCPHNPNFPKRVSWQDHAEPDGSDLTGLAF